MPFFPSFGFGSGSGSGGGVFGLGEILGILQLITTGASIAQQSGAFGGQQNISPKLPEAPAAPKDLTSFEKYGGIMGEAPPGLRFGTGITPLQESTQIATFGTQGTDSIYRDPATQKYFRDLLLNRVLDNKGNVRQGASVLPIEQQYIKTVLGENILDPDNPASSLSAAIRALG